LHLNEFLRTCLIVCPLVFLGGFVDSIAGGGGIITIPAYLLAGFPAHLAAGTNKLVASCGSVTAVIKYLRSGTVRIRIALFAAAGSLVGGALGARLALLVSEHVLKLIILVCLPLVAVFLITRKDFGKEPVDRGYSASKQAVLSAAIGLLIGCYDGMVGPGTGTFLILFFTGILGIDLLTSSSCARVANMASNLASCAVFILGGQVRYLVALPAGACSILGNWLGARYAVRGGSKSIRKVMFVVLGLLFLKLGYDYFIAK